MKKFELPKMTEEEKLEELNRERRGGNRLVGFVMCFAILLFLIGVFVLGYRLYAVIEDKRIEERAYSTAEAVIGVDNPEEDDENVYLDKDLIATLQEAFKNKDVIAYISFPEAGITYPVVQGKDNSQYLYHNIYGQYSINGSIFLDSDNNNDFSSVSSVVYGHHMNNGSMFGSLERSLGNWKDKTFKIYTRDEMLTYKIVCTEVISHDDRDFFIGKKSKSEVQEFTDNLNKKKIDSAFIVDDDFANPYLYRCEEFTKAFKSRYPSCLVDEDMTNFVTLLTCHYGGGTTSRFGATGGLVNSKNIVIKDKEEK
jgi:sortase B